MQYESFGPVVNPDGTPTEFTKQMLAGTGRDISDVMDKKIYWVFLNIYKTDGTCETKHDFPQGYNWVKSFSEAVEEIVGEYGNAPKYFGKLSHIGMTPDWDNNKLFAWWITITDEYTNEARFYIHM